MRSRPFAACHEASRRRRITVAARAQRLPSFAACARTAAGARAAISLFTSLARHARRTRGRPHPFTRSPPSCTASRRVRGLRCLVFLARPHAPRRRVAAPRACAAARSRDAFSAADPAAQDVMRASPCRAGLHPRRGAVPLCVSSCTAAPPPPARKHCARAAAPRHAQRLHVRRSARPQRAPPLRCSSSAADKAQPANDDGAEEALGRAMLLGVAAAYGSLTVACRYVFLLPGPPVRCPAWPCQPTLPAPSPPPHLLTRSALSR